MKDSYAIQIQKCWRWYKIVKRPLKIKRINFIKQRWLQIRFHPEGKIVKEKAKNWKIQNKIDFKVDSNHK